LSSKLIFQTVSKKTLEEPIEMPVAEPYHPEPIPAWLDNWKPWIATTIVLILIAYTPVLIYLFGNLNATSPGFKVW
jgi:hypothetical protein